MDKLQVPAHLVSLRLCGNLSSLPNWISSLNDLGKVKLRGTQLKQEDIGRFQKLCNLTLLGLWENSYIGDSFHFCNIQQNIEIGFHVLFYTNPPINSNKPTWLSMQKTPSACASIYWQGQKPSLNTDIISQKPHFYLPKTIPVQTHGIILAQQ